jgi:hypothetical protein
MGVVAATSFVGNLQPYVDEWASAAHRGEHFSGRAKKKLCYFGPKKSCR